MQQAGFTTFSTTSNNGLHTRNTFGDVSPNIEMLPKPVASKPRLGSRLTTMVR